MASLSKLTPAAFLGYPYQNLHVVLPVYGHEEVLSFPFSRAVPAIQFIFFS